MRQFTVAFGSISVYPRGDCARAARTWKSGHYWLTLFAQYLARQWIHVHVLHLVAV